MNNLVNLVKVKSAQLIFFNVGQGNCTIMKVFETHVDPSQNPHVWLVDAGSGENPFPVLSFDKKLEKKRDQQALEIYDYLVDQAPPATLHIVISHFDTDHYVLVNLVYKMCKERSELKNVKVKFYTNLPENVHLKDYSIIVGENDEHVRIEGQAKGTVFDWDGRKLENFNTGPVHFINTSFVGDEEGEKKKRGRKAKSSEEDSKDGDGGKETQDKKKNDRSLVVKFNHKPFSALIPGDATKDTYERCLQDELKATILLLSHHGAETHGSNSVEIIKNRIKPDYIVCSSHIQSHFGHPTPKTVEIVRDYFGGKTMQPTDEIYHLLYFDTSFDYTNIGNVEAPGCNKNFFSVFTMTEKQKSGNTNINFKTFFATSYPFFHTGSNGTIVFDWEPNSSTPQYHFYDPTLEDKFYLRNPFNLITENVIQPKTKLMDSLVTFFKDRDKLGPYDLVALNYMGKDVASWNNFKKEFPGLENLRAINLTHSDFKDLGLEFVDELLNHPKLFKIAILENQFDKKKLEVDKAKAQKYLKRLLGY